MRKKRGVPKNSMTMLFWHPADAWTLIPVQRSDICIVGGGASGIALLAQLIKRAGRTGGVRSIAVIEKGPVVGPGLAYSTTYDCNVLNMRASTMSLYPDDPGHFCRWMRSQCTALSAAHPLFNSDDPYPPRSVYGAYLIAMAGELQAAARAVGVEARFIRGDVTDIVEKDGSMLMTLADGHTHRAGKVALTLGNFPSSLHGSLIGTRGYFHSPWPDVRLMRDIPRDADVIIIGTRLSGIDAALMLAENGHSGSLTLVSRSGVLPAVQGIRLPYTRRWKMEELARDLEACPNDAFRRIVNFLKEEITLYCGSAGLSRAQQTVPPLRALREDLEAARSGQVSWQSVLVATAGCIERFWNCCDPETRTLFLERHLSRWFACRHAIPIKNAERILRLMESGQLRVLSGLHSIRHDPDAGIFSVTRQQGNTLRSRILINATGEEYDTARIRSPLLGRLLAGGMLAAHPQGGVHVDFRTCEAIGPAPRSPGTLFVIGSLTRGVHFYTNAIDRNVAHAARVSDAMLPLPPAAPARARRRALRIAFFVGSDIMSHLMASALVPELLMAGHRPIIFATADSLPASPRPPPLRELAFFERQLLQRHVAPLIDSMPPDAGAPHRTIGQMHATFGIDVRAIRSVNDPAFLAELDALSVDVGISLRCYQKFGRDIIRHFQAGGRMLLNLHPGILPHYRGVMTTIRAMANGERNFGYTLHHISEEYDAGAVADIRTRPLDCAMPMLGYMATVYPVGVGMILDAMQCVASGEELPSLAQGDGTYYSFPTERDLAGYARKGIRLVDPDAACEFLACQFAVPGSTAHALVQKRICDATREWYGAPFAPALSRPLLPTHSLSVL